VEGLKEFVKSLRVGNKAFFAQYCSKRHFCFLSLADYGIGGWKGFIVLLEGSDRTGWRGFAREPHKVSDLF
jgi:hypothetical protein